MTNKPIVASLSFLFQERSVSIWNRMADREMETQSSFNVGSDKVVVEGENLLVHATEEMDWAVREFSRVPIYVRDKKYYLRSKQPQGGPFKMVYSLYPWPEKSLDKSSVTVFYDEDYVQHRNESAASTRTHALLYYLLLPLYPFLGLLWADFKNDVIRRVGYEPGRITRLSVFLVFNLFVLQAIFFVYLKGGLLQQITGNPKVLLVDLALIPLLLADVILRYSRASKPDVQRYWGFLEWAFPGASVDQ